MDEAVPKSALTSPKEISFGTLKDVSIITETINKAFIGDGNGWTDCNLVMQNHPRVNETQVENYMSKPNSVFFKYECEDGSFGGCLYLEDMGDKKYHLWLMAVVPSKQNQGIGRKLLEASVDYARHKNYKLIEFTTTASRGNVLAWYERRGFTNTGEIIDFNLSSVIPTTEKIVVKNAVFVKYL